MILTVDFLRAAVPSPGPKYNVGAILDAFAPHLTVTCAEADITTRERLACFLAQVGHESGSFVHVRELWGPTPAQVRYEGRKDLGNVRPGDGKRFRGRGLIQVTGRANYAAASAARGVDFVAQPELLELPDHAAWSAGWYWTTRGLNALADRMAFRELTKKINGGYNGLPDRCVRLAQALEALVAVDLGAAVP